MCLIPVTSMAIAPPGVIAEKNLKAPVILIGEVVNINKESDLPYFSIKAGHIIKGHDHVKTGDLVNIVYHPAISKSKNDKISSHAQGILPVNVEKGSLVIVYIEQLKTHPGFFNPILKGLSVVKVGNP